MQNDIVLLIIGAVAGFMSAILMELIKNNLERKRLKQEQKDNSLQSKEKNVRGFLSAESAATHWPALLKLVKTQKATLLSIIATNDNSSITKEITQPPNERKTVQLLKKDIKRVLDARNENNKTIEKYLLSNMQIIGREETCDIYISDKTVSRIHALIRYEKKRYVIYDLGSSSGTYVHDIKVGEGGIVLNNLDTIALGESVFIFEGVNPDIELIKAKTNSKKR